MSTLSPTLLAVGVVGVGAGVTLILTAPSSANATNAEHAIAKRMTLTAGFGRLDATWRF